MKLPVSIAKKLLQLMQGESLPASSLQHEAISKMIEDGVIYKLQSGKNKAVLYGPDAQALQQYISNRYSITRLEAYIDQYTAKEILRSESVLVSGNSKLRSTRTFKGFLVNTFSPVKATLQGRQIDINPADGSFVFINDYTTFKVHTSVTIVGIENAENFCNVSHQQYLFTGYQPLFVTRYPHSNDLVKWLQSIPNNYLHFGDLDFEGINIYLNEFKKHLGERATFFIPEQMEDMLAKYGNRQLYNTQLNRLNNQRIIEPSIHQLIRLFHKHKKVLEQEVFIKR